MTAAAQHLPGRAAHRLIRGTALAAAIAIVASAMMLALAGIHIPRWIGFRMVMGVLLAANGIWWMIADGWLNANLAGAIRIVLRTTVAIVLLALISPIVLMLVSGHAGAMTGVPVWVMSAIQ